MRFKIIDCALTAGHLILDTHVLDVHKPDGRESYYSTIKLQRP